ncbi:hypothetical protein BGZ94_006747 [Podila epigama]|nr:hypothetical protein BGZ94_006747 [Podila epigama]
MSLQTIGTNHTPLSTLIKNNHSDPVSSSTIGGTSRCWKTVGSPPRRLTRSPPHPQQFPPQAQPQRETLPRPMTKTMTMTMNMNVNMNKTLTHSSGGESESEERWRRGEHKARVLLDESDASLTKSNVIRPMEIHATLFDESSRHGDQPTHRVPLDQSPPVSLSPLVASPLPPSSSLLSLSTTSTPTPTPTSTSTMPSSQITAAYAHAPVFGPSLDMGTGSSPNITSGSGSGSGSGTGFGQGFTSPVAVSKPFSLDLNAAPAGSAQRSRAGLESPLNVSSFIWTGRVADATEPILPLSSLPTMTSLAGDNIGSMLSLDKSNESYSNANNDNDNNNSNSSSLFQDGDSIGPDLPFTNRRSLSFSDPGGFPSGLGTNRLSAGNGFLPQTHTHGQDTSTAMGLIRVPPSILEEDSEDMFEPRFNRIRSHSTSATLGNGGLYSIYMQSSIETQNNFIPPTNTTTSIHSRYSQFKRHSIHSHLAAGSAWPGPWSTALDLGHDGGPARRRSMTGEYNGPIWESQNMASPAIHSDSHFYEEQRQRPMRRFSVAPSSGFQNYNQYIENADNYTRQNTFTFDRQATETELGNLQRRHSVAGPSLSYQQPDSWTTFENAMDNLRLDTESNERMPEAQIDSTVGQELEYNIEGVVQPMTLSQISRHGHLYVVEFKGGRSDLFYVTKASGMKLNCGDLVIVEADRGKDLGKITNDSITPQQVQAIQIQNAEAAAVSASMGNTQAEAGRLPKEIHPKLIYRLAHSSEIAALVNKSQDEMKALLVCQTKVRQKKLLMHIVDAEYQWDRRKLTFFFVAEHRIDFRELVRELFKIYKTRIWMNVHTTTAMILHTKRLARQWLLHEDRLSDSALEQVSFSLSSSLSSSFGSPFMKNAQVVLGLIVGKIIAWSLESWVH